MDKLRRRLPSMNSLFTFEAAARFCNFSKAAEELNVTPAAVSRMISRLEEHLGIALFVRQPGGVDVTAPGRILFDAIAQGFSGIDNALREIEDHKTGLETITLSASTGFTTHWMMPRMADFKRAFPKVDLRFQLVMGELAGEVHDVDIGMRFGSGPDALHEAAYIIPEILIPISNNSYRDNHLRDGSWCQEIDKLAHLDDMRMAWSNLFVPGNVNDSMKFLDYAIVVQAALLGQGVAFGWLNVIAHWLSTGALVPARPWLIVTQRQCLFLRSRKKPLRPIVADVQDWIIAELNRDVMGVNERYPELGLKPIIEKNAKG
ncbi:LysR family transcriptional regulator [Pseudochelatococcus contaminans]|uniref:LysR family transcriptional regulator n=1 Tax=Pseudochelatococcus contaminans TaxID=1538103 RepID=UPI00160E033C